MSPDKHLLRSFNAMSTKTTVMTIHMITDYILLTVYLHILVFSTLNPCRKAASQRVVQSMPWQFMNCTVFREFFDRMVSKSSDPSILAPVKFNTSSLTRGWLENCRVFRLLPVIFSFVEIFLTFKGGRLNKLFVKDGPKEHSQNSSDFSCSIESSKSCLSLNRVPWLLYSEKENLHIH